MSVNRHQPHVLVLPEDDANSQVANGFLLDRHLSPRTIQVLPLAGGWIKVLDEFQSEITGMERHAHRFMVLLIDFDGREERLRYAKSQVPGYLQERVFILGALGEPEDLKRAIPGSYETIGLKLAQDCRDGTNSTWGHPLLRHNASELDRMREQIRPILFPTI